jgi:hypothetical protein
MIIVQEPTQSLAAPRWPFALLQGTNGAPATAVGYSMHTPSVEESDLPKTGAFDKIVFRYS